MRKQIFKERIKSDQHPDFYTYDGQNCHRIHLSNFSNTDSYISLNIKQNLLKMKIYQISLPEEIGVKQTINIVGKQIEMNLIEHLKFVHNELYIDKVYHKNKYGFRLSESEILNYLTHRNVWKEFLGTKDDWCLVIEDNVNLNLNSKDLFTLVSELNENYQDWDVFFPYDIFEIQKKTIKVGELMNHNWWESNKNYYYHLNCKWGNSIYLLSRKGARKLLKLSTINDRLDNTLLNLAEEERLNLYYEDINWFHYNSIIQYEWIERCQLMLDMIKNTISWEEDSIIKVRKILQVISAIGCEKNIDILLQGGSHLGYIRHGGIIPWDDDVDLGIEEKNIELFFSELNKNKKYLYGQFIEPVTLIPYYKIWRIDGKPIKNYDYTFPFVDIWPFNIQGKDYIFKNGIICPNSALAPLVDVCFEGSYFKIPYNSFEVLDSRYTDWKNHLHIYPWSHKQESRVRKLMCIPIKIDKNGRANLSCSIFDFINLKTKGS